MSYCNCLPEMLEMLTCYALANDDIGTQELDSVAGFSRITQRQIYEMLSVVGRLLIERQSLQYANKQLTDEEVTDFQTDLITLFGEFGVALDGIRQQAYAKAEWRRQDARLKEKNAK